MDLKRSLLKRVAALLLLCGLLPLNALMEAAPGFTVVPVLWLNAGKDKAVFMEPDSKSEKLGRLEAGEAFEMLNQDGAYAEVLVFNAAGDRVHGYVENESLRQKTEEDGPALAVISSSDPVKRAVLRSGASDNSKQLGKYFNGVVARLTQAPKGNWVKVDIGGLEGFIRVRDLVMDGPVGSVLSLIPTVTVQYAKASSLTFRAAPSYQAEKLGAVPNGESVRVLGVTDEFAHVLTPDGREAFMMASGLSPQPTTADTAPAQALPQPEGYLSVIDNPEGQGAHLRLRGSTSSDSLGLYPNGTEVVVIGGTAWWKQVWVDGKTGYMLATLIRGFVPEDDPDDGYGDYIEGVSPWP